jgi:NADPH:quinone reductase-like Zn-dependent oxidoreductase
MAAEKLGDLTGIRCVELPVPAPAAGEVRVRVDHAAVNPADHKVLSGAFAGRFLHARSVPLVVGYDFSGTVDAIGAGVTSVGEGDEVFGHLAYAGSTRQGTFSERVTIAETNVARKPPSVSHELAAVAATAGLTALQGLRDAGGLTAGGRALVYGASGGVGSLAIGLAKRLGAEVTGVCSTHAVELVRELGADVVVDREKQDPMAIDGPFDVVFDTPAAYSFGRERHRLSPGGVYVTTLPSPRLFAGKIAALFFSQRCAMLVVASKRADLATLGEWLAEGLQVPIDARYQVREVAAAVDRVAGGQRSGRIAIDVAGGW